MTSSADIARLWSGLAGSFDREPDHGLTSPAVHDAWEQRLATWIPASAHRTLDVGCGTASLSLILAGRGHRVTAIDLSRGMLSEAARKRARLGLSFPLAVADASDPPFRPGSFDAILCRHLLWTLPHPRIAIARWSRLLRPSGRLVAIEGRWNPAPGQSDPDLPWDGGVSAQQLVSALEPLFHHVELIDLARDGQLWGHTVTDERFAVIATKPADPRPGSASPA